jgi:6-phosphofructokinase 1
VAIAKKIGILTSGGDCPGLNAIIRSAVKCATHLGWEVYGIPHGTDGFIQIAEGQCQPADLRLTENGYDIPGYLHGLDVLQFLSGSILGSLSKGNPQHPEVQAKILAGYQQLGIEALIVVGGDGSLDIIGDLAAAGHWKIIAIPKTIDNDVPFTEQAVGFDTAVNTVTNALYDLTFTAASHDRVIVVQFMGRDAGHLALRSGIAGGADAILIPELIPHLAAEIIDDLSVHIAHLHQRGRKFALIVVAEGVKNAQGQKEKYIADSLATALRDRCRGLCQSGREEFCELDQVEARATVLGHIQRSGTPSSFDRLLATAFGKKAIDLIAAAEWNQLVVWVSGKVQTRSLAEVLPVLKQCHRENRCTDPVQPHDYLVEVARSLGIYVGAALPSPHGSQPTEWQNLKSSLRSSALEVCR